MPRGVYNKRTKHVNCVVCGKPAMVGATKKKAYRCLECGIAAMMSNAQQMREKSGPNYDKHLRGLAAYLYRSTWGAIPPLQEELESYASTDAD